MARYTLIAPEATATSSAGVEGEQSITCDVYTGTRDSGGGRQLEVLVDDVKVHAILLDAGPPYLLSIDDKPVEVILNAAGEYRVVSTGAILRVVTGASKRTSAATTNRSLLAPMPGRIVRVLCRVGDVVDAGTPLVILEAMKMENELLAPTRGQVEHVFIQEGSAVEARAKLVALAEA